MPRASASQEYRVTFKLSSSRSLDSPIRLSEGWLTPVRHRGRATHTQQTAHPQFQAGAITRHRATVYMPVRRLVLAPRMQRAHRGKRGISRREAPYPGPEYQAETQYLWVNVSRLRKKLEPTADSPRYIHTQQGVGYVFRRP